jgi:hypothetical protein
MFYETDKRKIQADRKILAHQIPAGERERARVCRYVCSDDAGLYVVGNAGILISIALIHAFVPPIRGWFPSWPGCRTLSGYNKTHEELSIQAGIRSP